MRWDHSLDQRLGRDAVQTTHRLGELPVFSDEGLAAILDRYPRKAVRLATMGDNPAHPSELQFGKLGGYSGLELIEMIRCGRLCLRIHNVASHHEGLGRIVQRLCQEMMECQPSLRTFDHDGDLEISSPSAMNYYGIDIQPTVAWQIRGTRTVWLYPTGEPFIIPRTLERVVASDDSTPLYFEPTFDDQAQLLEQSCDRVLALPQHSPYRIANDHGLNVTLITKYHTRESQRRNEVHCANHLLSQFFPSDTRSCRASGFGSAAKRLLLRIARRRSTKVSGNGRQRSEASNLRPIVPTFCVNPAATWCAGTLETTPLATETPVPTFPGLFLDSTNSATAG